MANNRTLTILLFTVSLVAALAMGVAATLWLTRSNAPAASSQAAQPAPQTSPASAQSQAPASSAATAIGQPQSETFPPGQSQADSLAAQSGAASVFINQVEATRAQLEELRRTYGAEPPPGRYWYDPRSGLYGMWGHEAAGYIRSGHWFAPLPPEASNGNTGVFINGRQLNMTEAMFLQRIFGVVYQGRWWLDGQTGNIGAEGNPTPIANLVAAIQQAQRSSGRGEYNYRDSLSGTSASSDGKCMWMNVPGSGSVMSSGC